jgi:hypothetical protein
MAARLVIFTYVPMQIITLAPQIRASAERYRQAKRSSHLILA